MTLPTVVVVGLGQIGGSLAAALTRRRLATVIGVTRREETARRARRMGILARAGTDLGPVAAADLVVLATPVRTLLRQVAAVAPLARPGAILTDVGSTKKDILDAFRRSRPRASVVGGHPMAGNEKAGLDGCDPDLFEHRPWVLIPLRPADRPRGRALERLVRGVGARPVWMSDPRDHDLAVARVSHVPYLLAYALADQPESALRVAGNSFRDATRVALSEPEMVLDFLLTNRKPLRRAAGELLGRLRELLRLLGGAEEAALRRKFRRARRRREGL
jgi:prephenate dehydrogenase